MIAIKDSGIILNKCFDDEISQEANSTYQLKFNYPVDDDTWEQLKEETLLTADDLHGEQEFSIIEVEKYNGYITVYAKQVATLLNGYSINKLSVDRVNGATVMQALISASNRPIPFTLYSDIEDKHTLNVSNQSVMDTISKDKHCIIGQWGGDLIRDKYAISLLKNGGSENESLFMYKKNLHTLHGHSSSKNLATRIHFWKKIESHEEGKKDQLIEITLDSPLINKYRNIYEDNVEVNDEKITDIEALKKYGQDYFKNNLCDMIEDTLEIDVIGQPDVPVHMFDVVTIFHERYNVDLRKKITKYTYSPVSKQLKSIGFGQISRTVNSIVHETIENKVNDAIAVTKADFKREFDNSNKIIEQKQEELEHQIVDGIEQAKSKAEVVKAEINSDIQSKLSPIQIDVQNFKRDFQNDLSTARNELLSLKNRQVDKSAIDNSIEVIKNGLERSMRLVENANNDNRATIIQLKNGINELNQTSTVTKERLTHTESDIRRLSVEVSSRVNQSDFDTLKQRLTSSETLLRQTANSVEAKASKSDLDKISGSLVNNTAQLNVLNNRISSEVQRIEGLIPDRDKVGRNLYFGTKLFSTNFWLNLSYWREDGYFNGFKILKISRTDARLCQNLSAEPNTDYTISAWLKRSKSGRVNRSGASFKNSNILAWNETFVDVGTEWARYSYTFRTPANTTHIQPGFQLKDSDTTLWICGIKVEKGNQSSDWIPAPEDTDSVFDVLNTKINQTANLIESKANRDEFDNLNQRVTSAESTVRQAADRINNEISRIPKSYSGNLLVNSNPKENGYSRHDISFKLAKPLYAGNEYTLTTRYWHGNGATGQVFNDGTGVYRWLNYDSTVDAWVAKFKPTKNVEEGEYLTLSADPVNAIGNWEFATLIKGNLPMSAWSSSDVDMVNELNTLKSKFEQTADSIRQSVSELSANAIKQSDVSITSSGIVMRAGITDPKKSVGDLAAASFRLNPYQIDLFAEKIRVKGDMLVDGAITSQKIASGSIDTAQLRAGAVNTTILSSDAVTADKLRVDEALFNKLSAGEVLAQKLFAKSAFITSVQSVDLSANRITSGMLRARNGAVNFNLDSGQLNFYTDAPALRRVIQGYPNQFIAFKTGTYDNKPCGVTLIGSNRDEVENTNSGSFAGIRIWNSKDADQTDVIGDIIHLSSNPNDDSDGWRVDTLHYKLNIQPRRQQDYRSSQITAGDFIFINSDGRRFSLRQLFKDLFHNTQEFGNRTGGFNNVFTNSAPD